MTEYKQHLKNLKILGFDISNDNSHVITSTAEAEEYCSQRYEEPVKFILGNILAETETLDNVEYDVMFSAIEEHSHRITPYEYHYFHKNIHVWTTDEFIKELDNYNGDQYVDIKEFVIDYMDDINLELEEIYFGIKALKAGE